MANDTADNTADNTLDAVQDNAGDYGPGVKAGCDKDQDAKNEYSVSHV